MSLRRRLRPYAATLAPCAVPAFTVLGASAVVATALAFEGTTEAPLYVGGLLVALLLGALGLDSALERI